jgi:hypothetical protein
LRSNLADQRGVVNFEHREESTGLDIFALVFRRKVIREIRNQSVGNEPDERGITRAEVQAVGAV